MICMGRPSQQIDQALLASGRALFARTGCAGLTVRALAEHAGVAPGMFHYHFGSKDRFLRTLLAGWYDEMYGSLVQRASLEGEPLERLRAALSVLARFARANRALMARLWADAVAGEVVAREFFQQHVPRHAALLLTLLSEGQSAGTLRALPPLTALSFLMVALALPSVFVAALVDAGFALPGGKAAFDGQVMSDAALDARIELALAALAVPQQRPARRASRPPGRGAARPRKRSTR
jgi:AcrR family transcriptional regulator